MHLQCKGSENVHRSKLSGVWGQQTLEVILYQSEKKTDILREAVRHLKAQLVSTEVRIQELELLTDIIPFFMGYNSVRKQISKSAINIHRMLGSEDSSEGKMLAIKPDNLNSMPETHMVEGEKYFAVIF